MYALCVQSIFLEILLFSVPLERASDAIDRSSLEGAEISIGRGRVGLLDADRCVVVVRRR